MKEGAKKVSDDIWFQRGLLQSLQQYKPELVKKILKLQNELRELYVQEEECKKRIKFLENKE